MAIRLTSASSQHLQASGGPDYRNDYTVCGWVRMASLPPLETFGEMTLVCVGDANTPHSADRVGVWGPFGANRFVAGAISGYSANDFDLDTTISVATGTWYHVAMVRVGDDVTVYINGSLLITVTATTSSWRSSVDHVVFGAWVTDGGTLESYADAEYEGWKAYGRALTSAELLAEAQALAPKCARSLVASWPMVSGANRGRDLVGALPLTEYGSPTDAVGAKGYGWPGPQVGVPSAAADDEIAGAVNGAASLTCALTGRGAVAGAITGAASLAGAVTGRGLVAGSATGSASLTCALTGRGAVAGAATGVASLTCALVGRGTLAAAVAGAAALVGAVVAVGVIAGNVTGAASLTGQFLTDGLQGNVTGAASLTAALTGRGLVAGAATGAASIAAQLVGSGALAGAVTGAASLTAAIITSDRLAGAVTGAASLVCAIVGRGLLAGAVIAQAVVACTLTGPAPPIVGTWQPGPPYVPPRQRPASPFFRW